MSLNPLISLKNNLRGWCEGDHRDNALKITFKGLLLVTV